MVCATRYRLPEDGKIDIGDSIMEIAKHVSQQPTSTSIEKRSKHLHPSSKHQCRVIDTWTSVIEKLISGIEHQCDFTIRIFVHYGAPYGKSIKSTLIRTDIKIT